MKKCFCKNLTMAYTALYKEFHEIYPKYIHSEALFFVLLMRKGASVIVPASKVMSLVCV